MRIASLLVTLGVASPGLAQEDCTLLVDGAAGGVCVRGDASWSRAGDSLHAELPSGWWILLFGASAGIRPASLATAAPAGGSVHVACERPATGSVSERVVVEEATSTLRIAAAPQPDVRVRARVVAHQGEAGLAVRFADADNHYRLVIDDKGEAWRLVRRMGGVERVLREGLLPGGPAPGAERMLELECEGFSLLALCDDEPLVGCMDGGLDAGAAALFVAPGANARIVEAAVSAPAPLGASLVCVQDGAAAQVTARVPGNADGAWFLCLENARPQPLRVLAESGFEPFLLRDPAEPWFLPFAFGHLSADGELSGELHWPDAPSLRLQSALVGGFVGSADGSALAQRLPWAVVRF